MSVGYILLNIDKEGTPSTKLGPKMGMESRSLTRSLKTMEQNGLIIRKPDSTDRRMVRVFLTEEGRAYRNTSRQVVLRLNEYLQSEIAPAKLKVFFEVMESLNELLDADLIFKKTVLHKNLK